MKDTTRFCAWLLVITSMFVWSAVAGTHAGLKKRVAVMDMSMSTTTLSQASPGAITTTTTIQIPPPSDFAMGLTEILTTELAKTERLIVLEQKALADITAEQELATAGKVNPETAAKTGAIVGAQGLVRCAVTEYAYTQTGTSANIKIIQGLNVGATLVRAMVGLDCRIYDGKSSEIQASRAQRNDIIRPLSAGANP